MGVHAKPLAPLLPGRGRGRADRDFLQTYTTMAFFASELALFALLGLVSPARWARRPQRCQWLLQCLRSALAASRPGSATDFVLESELALCCWAQSRPAAVMLVSSSIPALLPGTSQLLPDVTHHAFCACTHAGHLDAAHRMDCSAFQEVGCAARCPQRAHTAQLCPGALRHAWVCSAAAGQSCRGRCWACTPPSMPCTRHSHGARRAGAWKPTSRALRRVCCPAPGRTGVNTMAMCRRVLQGAHEMACMPPMCQT